MATAERAWERAGGHDVQEANAAALRGLGFARLSRMLADCSAS